MKRTDSLLLAVYGSVMLLAGVLLAGAWAPNAAHAGTANSSPGVVAVTGLASSNQEVLYLYEADTRHLAVYKVDASNRLELIAVRDATYDLKPQEFGKNEPSVKDMKAAFEAHEDRMAGKDGRQRR